MESYEVRVSLEHMDGTIKRTSVGRVWRNLDNSWGAHDAYMSGRTIQSGLSSRRMAKNWMLSPANGWGL
jgi:hypothetical protein